MESPIPSRVPLNDLLALSVPEKIALIGALTDSIDETLPIPAWQLEELDRRKAAAERNPDSLVPWEAVKQRMGLNRGA